LVNMIIKAGNFEIYPLLDGYFWLDGGMMFRQAKIAWENLYKPDEKNRIKLASHCYLIKGKALTLFDSGMGDPSDPVFAAIAGSSYKDFFGIDQTNGNLVTSLAKAGFSPPDIHFVSQSHLHLDHTGWHVWTDPQSGKIMPFFPKATYLIDEKELGAGDKSHPLSLKSYRKVAFQTLFEVDPNFSLRYVWKSRWKHFEREPGFVFIRTGGHTHGHWVALIESGKAKIFLAGDLIPTHKHIVPVNVMSYDLWPTKVYSAKVKFLEQAAKENWLILFDHDPDYIGGYVTKDKKGHFEFSPAIF